MSDVSITAPKPSLSTETRPMPSSSGDTPSLSSEQGTTTIADTVVSKIAAIAAREVDGVAELGGSIAGAIGSVVGRIRGKENTTAGVGVEVGATQAAVDLSMRVMYPASIHGVADAVRQNVIDRIESMTGLSVVEVNIAVVDLVFPGSEDEADTSQNQTQSRVA